jgi:hypothetical protein
MAWYGWVLLDRKQNNGYGCWSEQGDGKQGISVADTRGLLLFASLLSFVQ